jgi:hypothetical protein
MDELFISLFDETIRIENATWLTDCKAAARKIYRGLDKARDRAVYISRI